MAGVNFAISVTRGVSGILRLYYSDYKDYNVCGLFIHVRHSNLYNEETREPQV
jgi:hypothetical protein